MSPGDERPRRRYKVRGTGGQSEWVDHNDLWRLQQQQIERLREDHRRRLRVAVLAAVALVAVVVAALWIALGRSGDPDPGATPEPAVTGAAAGAGAPAATPPPTPEEEIAAAVRAWAAAWGRQDVTAYLASYSAGFRPADGSRRGAWERRRRRRLERPASIQLDLGELEIELLETGRAEVRFRQGYSSPEYADVVRKTLTLVAEEGGWRIVGEQAEPVTP